MSAGPALDADDRRAALETIATMQHRPSCNRITGCPGLTALAQHGQAAVPVILETLTTHGRDDGAWVVRLIEHLGQLKDPRARPYLQELLNDKRWEIPIRAAIALGHLGVADARPALEATLKHAISRKRRALEAACRDALQRLGVDVEAHRDAIVALLPADEAELAEIPPIILDILTEIVRMARLPRALPGVRVLARHKNRFVRIQALRTLGDLQDTGGVPYALDRLDDEIPSIRRAALAALQKITGIPTMTEKRHWLAWAERHGLAELPKAEPTPTP